MQNIDKYYLGIDLGTSSIKVSISDYKGKIILSESESYPLLMPNENWTEQNPDDWYNALINVLKRLNKEVDLSKVASLSFCGQMHGLVVLDENDKVIRPAILWNDSRTVKEVDYLNNVIGVNKLIEYTSNIALCGFTAPKILWLRKNEPENFKKINKIMLPKDYLAYKISGVFASDVSDLSGTLFFDVKNNVYSIKMLDILGINPSQLPVIYNSYDVIGNVSDEFAKLSGLSNKTKVVIGGGDQAVGAIGTATISNDDLFISLGTSGVVFSSIDNYAYDKLGRIHSFRHANGKFLLMGCTLSCAGSLNWWFKDVLNIKNYDDEFENVDINNMNDILFLPYLMGERSPINDPNAKGMFANLNAIYKRGDMTKAVVEGISYSLYDVFSIMKDLNLDFKEARVIGGGSRNKKWMQLLADIFGIKIKTISTSDGGALGAIILAMYGDKQYKYLKEACDELVHDKDIYMPNLKNHIIYQKKFEQYRQLYLKNKN